MPLQRTSSVWFDPEPALPECAAVEEHLEADVCVVGAGIAGLRGSPERSIPVSY
jgi:hypothetical protein